MSGISSWLWGTSQIDEAVDKATSDLLPAGSEDIALNLEICDQIRSKSAPPKDSMKALKRRLNHKNPNVQLLALSLTDICVKNGGDHFLVEVASREFMDNLVSILKIPNLNRDVMGKILRYIQNWSIAFGQKPHLNYVGQVYRQLKSEGFNFPPEDLSVSTSAMVDTKTAPEWIDSDVCLRCRDPFSFTNRKHHCRNCGKVYDQKCSSKSLPLPHFGITQDVRVCDSCHKELTKHKDKGISSETYKRHRTSHSVPNGRHRSARDLADAELQRAIQLSLQEVNGRGEHGRPGYVPYQEQPWQASEPPLVDRSSRPVEEEDDPDLKAAIEASLQEASAPRPSAPVALETPRAEESPYGWSNAGYSQSYPPTVTATPQPDIPALPNHDLAPLESDTILTFSQTVEQVQAQGGRDMSRYPAVTQLFDKANSLRPKLVMSLDDTGRKEEMLAEMNDKLSQAVKLYDQLLTEQLSRRTHPPTQYQTAQYHPPDRSYGQWNAQQQPPMSPHAYQQPVTTHYAPALQAYQPSEPSFTSSPPPMQRSFSQYSDPSVSQPFAPPISQPSAPQSSYVPSAPSAPPGPSHAPGPIPASIPQHVYQAVASPPPMAPSQLPQQILRQPSAPASIQSPPPQPAPAHFAPPPPPSQPTQASTTHAPPPSIHSTLARQNTAPYVPPQQQQQQQQQQQYQHQQYQPQYQPQMPVFPTAPTNAPSAYSLYDTNVPRGIAQPEQKEALLIDL